MLAGCNSMLTLTFLVPFIPTDLGRITMHSTLILPLTKLSHSFYHEKKRMSQYVLVNFNVLHAVTQLLQGNCFHIVFFTNMADVDQGMSLPNLRLVLL